MSEELDKNNIVLNEIYRFDNYRAFLKEFFNEQKKIKNCFSHRYFAQKAGFNSSSFCAHVMDGKRNLSPNSLPKMIQGLGLKGKSAQFFENLVFFNQSKTLEERENFFHSLEKIRKSTDYYRVNHQQFAYYDEWYYPVIRELAVYANWSEDYNMLANLVRPKISPDKARRAVQELLDIGIIHKVSPGVYQQNSEVLVAENIPASIIRKSRKEFMLRAVEACENLGPKERHISSVTVAMSAESYRKLSKKIDEFRKQILDEAVNDPQVDAVYQINFQAFPLSEDIPRAKP
jgi:uncharacterized protein (TIGR02147 family)